LFCHHIGDEEVFSTVKGRRMASERERMLAGELYFPYDPELVADTAGVLENLFAYIWPRRTFPRLGISEPVMSAVRDGALSTGAARDKFAEVLNRAAFGKERVVLTRRGKPLVAVVPIEDVELLEAIEDRTDAEEARAALAAWWAEGSPSASLDEVLAEDGLSRDDLAQ
jgi:prevent-host-death family protein